MIWIQLAGDRLHIQFMSADVGAPAQRVFLSAVAGLLPLLPQIVATAYSQNQNHVMPEIVGKEQTHGPFSKFDPECPVI